MRLASAGHGLAFTERCSVIAICDSFAGWNAIPNSETIPQTTISLEVCLTPHHLLSICSAHAWLQNDLILSLVGMGLILPGEVE